MTNRKKVKKYITARLPILAVIVLTTLATVVQAGSASPGREVMKNIANFAPSTITLFTSTSNESSDQVAWKTITDENLGFSLQIPENWHELDLTKLHYFQGRCFAPTPGDNLTKPQFCIEVDPWVRPSNLKGFVSNDQKSQEDFFNEINANGINEEKVQDLKMQVVTRKYQHRGYPAIERTETISAAAEGLEPFYTVSIYVNHPRAGLIQLAMRTDDGQQYSQYEAIFKQISESFTLIR